MKTTQAIQQALTAKYDFNVFDDFDWYVTAHRWTSLAVDGGSSVSVSDARAGIVALVTGATNENEAAVRTTTEIFLPTADRPMYGIGCLQFTDVNTDDGNVFFGFMSALAADSLVDAGAGVRTSGSVFGIYKVDGGTVWRAHARNGSTATDSISVTTAGGASYQTLEVIVEEETTLRCTVTYKVDGAYLRDSTTQNVIEHKVLYASLTEMNFGVYAKTGDATPSSLTVNVDWLGAGQVR